MSDVQWLNLQLPVIQAPMVGVSTPALAAAVSNAGGLGSIGLGACSPEQARTMLQQTRALTAKPFNANLFCHRPARADAVRARAWLEHLRPLFAQFGAEPPAQLAEIYKSFANDPAMLEVLLELCPPVVSFHFGLPPQAFIDALKAKGIVLLATATSLAEARLIEQAGLDAVVAQGVEAGGHRGVFEPREDTRLGTFALVRCLAERVSLPVIAAGGIMDGAGIQAALTLGAQGVQMGTAFILCPESAANAAYRQALRSPRAECTAITAAISGRPARGLVNRWFTEVDCPTAPPLPDYPNTYDAAKALVAAAGVQGSDAFAVQWAGQGAPLARALPAAQLLAQLAEELDNARGGRVVKGGGRR
ncbi:NAD(P)H-dependent flavin oxidoreductase [Pseudomonas typographi]|uniref:Propionate 3-nitronate monooxygenase n=1 Tax=Pseudomonas typographi TaxID=2715964 RepID=A0ABR7Z1S9_9PSED|nr:nitronate monooxygenase [Pseudomonas typographi]MBD1551454.1 nitronate monooxygenase [Pseudomonas typographi]MBD1587560.1 nitronate monooxygenase [Pseudomonas typographi]MBD1599357.1 nitronate monooxygenase [Pseudomonas typographi]